MNAAESTLETPPPPPKKIERETPPSLAEKGNLPRAIAVRTLVLSKPRKIPGDDAAGAVQCDPKAPQNGRRWTISLIHAIRSFEIMFFPSDQKKPVEVVYVHETHADSWTPL